MCGPSLIQKMGFFDPLRSLTCLIQWQLWAERCISRCGNDLSPDKLLGPPFLKECGWCGERWGAVGLSRAGQLTWCEWSEVAVQDLGSWRSHPVGERQKFEKLKSHAHFGFDRSVIARGGGWRKVWLQKTAWGSFQCWANWLDPDCDGDYMNLHVC